MTKLDRKAGVLFGVAVGDAFGAPVEFMTEDEIEMNHFAAKNTQAIL